MTVAELIAKLAEFPPDMVVSVDGYEGGVTDDLDLRVSHVEVGYYGDGPKGIFGLHLELSEGDPDVTGKRLVLGR